MIGELVHCDPALIDSVETYRLYLQAVRDVCSFFLSERGAIHSGDLGRCGGGVACAQLPAEARNLESVRGFLENRGDFERAQAGVDGANGVVVSTSLFSRRGGDGSAVESGAAAGVGFGGADCRGGSAVREVSVGAGSAGQTNRVADGELGVVAGTEDLKPELVSVIQDGDVVSGSGFRGPNWERNRLAKDKKKRQKMARNARRGFPSASVHRPGVVESGLPTDGTVLGGRFAATNLARDNQEGFWNSCSKDVRQELIDSKARMHIAKNLREAKRAEEEVRQMESPEALLVRAMGMVDMAEKCAKKSNDSKVAGWAQTVATSYAESIAKSAPSTVPSYASVLSGTSATSVSVDGTKRKKPQVPVRKLRTYEGDPQHPAKSYYERRIKYMNTPGGLDDILDELVENKALAELDRTWLINDCYEKKARLGSPSVLAVIVD